jgi:glycosyltransferase involved in cell wall biosynthesis
MSRVAMLAYTHYRSDPRVRREAEALSRAGHSVTVFSLADPVRPAVPDGGGSGQGQPTLRQSTLRIDGVDVVGLPAGRYRGSSAPAYAFGYAAFTWTAARALQRQHRRQPFALVQVHTMPDFLVFAAWALKRAGVPVLLDIHDLMPELFQAKFGLSARHPLLALLRWQESACARFADRCLAVHGRHQRRLAERSANGVAVDVIHNLPDPRWFPVTAPTAIAAEDIRVVYHGTVAQRHGLEVAVEAMHRVHAQFPAARFDVYGDGDAAPSVARRIDALGATTYIGFRPGMQPLEELVPALRGAGIGVIPLLADSFTHYMLPTKLLEYVAMGVPVICSDLRSVRDYFSDRQVRFVAPGDVGDLAGALRELLSDADRRRRLAGAASAFYADFNWPAEERRYVSIVERMIDAGGLGRPAHTGSVA